MPSHRPRFRFLLALPPGLHRCRHRPLHPEQPGQLLSTPINTHTRMHTHTRMPMPMPSSRPRRLIILSLPPSLHRRRHRPLHPAQPGQLLSTPRFNCGQPPSHLPLHRRNCPSRMRSCEEQDVNEKGVNGRCESATSNSDVLGGL